MEDIRGREGIREKTKTIHRKLREEEREKGKGKKKRRR